MRAIVLLCLLHVAFGTPRFLWEPLASVEQDERAVSACTTDQGSCGCCQMLQKVHRLSTYFNSSLNELEDKYTLAKQRLDTIEASRIAVSVALFNGDRFKCYGPFSKNTVIVYKHVFLNVGESYSTETGILTVPYSGIYSVALTVYSDAGAPGNSLAACAGVQVNGVVMAGSSDRNTNDQEDSATVVVVLSLNKGDKLSVNLPMGCFLCDASDHYNTFSAFLLYVTD